ncbi:MAG: 5-oxoprolinase subunit PxpB [Clostridiales bacterium]|nr:5-oxoprolinase subunit PxpB [Clostridiales bacterium]
MTPPKFLPAGDRALVVEFGNGIDRATNDRVCALHRALCDRPIAGVLESVPTYRSLMVCYDPCALSAGALEKKLRRLLAAPGAAARSAAREVEIPVLYGGEFGPDLADVAAYARLTEEQVVALHAAPAYRVYMLGFLPGFAYLGGLDERIATPRLAAPRGRIEPGSVGIGGSQTGVYPVASPGGWRLIGRTPVKPYDPARDRPMPYAAGDLIRFVPIDRPTYDEIAGRVARGEYRCVAREVWG